MFPPALICKEIKKYLCKIDNNEDTSEEKKQQFYKLPYLGAISNQSKIKIKRLCNEFCKDTNITLSFSTNKIGSFLPTKSSMSETLRSHVVYKFSCAGCNAGYIGETTRHLTVRIKEHLQTDKESHILQHIKKNNTCRNKCNENCFIVIDRAATAFSLKLCILIGINQF